MSYTEIYGFKKDGTAFLAGEIKNAWRGAPAIWGILEERYLPPYIPDYIKYCNWYREDMSYEEIVERNGFQPTRNSSPPFGEHNPMKEIWDLNQREDISWPDLIALYTTYDNALAKRENFKAIIDAFDTFEGKTSLPEQARVLERLLADEDCIAVGWNQTSVNADNWCNIGEPDEDGDATPYNCLTGDQHFWIFDEEEVAGRQAGG